MSTTEFLNVPGLGRVKLGDKVKFRRAGRQTGQAFVGTIKDFKASGRGTWIVIEDEDGASFTTRGGLIEHVIDAA